MIDVEDFDSIGGVVFLDHFQDLHDRVETPIQELVYHSYFSCEDALLRKQAWVLSTVQRYNVNPIGTTCAELAGSCFTPENNYLRANCPISCGATLPQSGLFLDTPDHGVPSSCRTSFAFTQNLGAIDCIDPSPSDLAALDGWGKTWQLFKDYHGRLSADQNSCYERVAQMFNQQGCDAVSMLSTETCLDYTVAEFCSTLKALPRVQWFCPVACGCPTNLYNNSAACPPRCAR